MTLNGYEHIEFAISKVWTNLFIFSCYLKFENKIPVKLFNLLIVRMLLKIENEIQVILLFIDTSTEHFNCKLSIKSS